jgi:ERCC4-type nuclease
MVTDNLPSIKLKYTDSREPDTIRKKMLEYGWQQSALKSGDYIFQDYEYKWIGVTRKTVTDLINSIGDTFSYQLEIMLDSYPTNIWIIEGSWTNLRPDGVRTYNNQLSHQTWDSIWNYIHRWIARGFILELTTSENHTIHRLNALFALYQKNYSVSARSKDHADDRVLMFPSGSRGKTGMSLLKGRSMKDVVCMSEDELKEYGEKIGEKKAYAIHKHFNTVKG